MTYWYLMNGGQQIVGGLLAYCFTLIKPGGPLKSWQAIFICYGGFSFLWGLFVLWWLPDSPMRAKCFSEEDKVRKTSSPMYSVVLIPFPAPHGRARARQPDRYPKQDLPSRAG